MQSNIDIQVVKKKLQLFKKRLILEETIFKKKLKSLWCKKNDSAEINEAQSKLKPHSSDTRFGQLKTVVFKECRIEIWLIVELRSILVYIVLWFYLLFTFFPQSGFAGLMRLSWLQVWMCPTATNHRICYGCYEGEETSWTLPASNL